MIDVMLRHARRGLAIFLLVCAAGVAFAQEDERQLFTDFNWFDIMKMDSVSAFNALWDHAAKYTAANYDQKAILSLLLDQYLAAKDLEKQTPYDAGADAKAGTYILAHDRRYSARLALPWSLLVKLSVRSAMQYILLEVLNTNAVPRSKGRIPTNLSLFQEYFGYYVAMKKAG